MSKGIRVADDTHAALAARRGEPLAPRDALVAGAAKGLGERLVVSDADFDVPGVRDAVDVDFI